MRVVGCMRDCCPCRSSGPLSCARPQSSSLGMCPAPPPPHTQARGRSSRPLGCAPRPPQRSTCSLPPLHWAECALGGALPVISQFLLRTARLRLLRDHPAAKAMCLSPSEAALMQPAPQGYFSVPLLIGHLAALLPPRAARLSPIL